MRAILTALILGISVAAIASPALAGDNERDLGGNDRYIGASDSGASKVSVGAVAGSYEQAPVVQERFEKN